MTQVFHLIWQGHIHPENVADQDVYFPMILVSWVLEFRISQEIDTISRVIIIIGYTAQTMASVVSSSPLVDMSNRLETGIIIIPPVTCKQILFLNHNMICTN